MPVSDIELLELAKKLDSFVDLYRQAGYGSIHDVADRLEVMLKPYNIKVTLPLQLPKDVEEDLIKKLKAGMKVTPPPVWEVPPDMMKFRVGQYVKPKRNMKDEGILATDTFQVVDIDYKRQKIKLRTTDKEGIDLGYFNYKDFEPIQIHIEPIEGKITTKKLKEQVDYLTKLISTQMSKLTPLYEEVQKIKNNIDEYVKERIEKGLDVDEIKKDIDKVVSNLEKEIEKIYSRMGELEKIKKVAGKVEEKEEYKKGQEFVSDSGISYELVKVEGTAPNRIFYLKVKKAGNILKFPEVYFKKHLKAV